MLRRYTYDPMAMRTYTECCEPVSPEVAGLAKHVLRLFEEMRVLRDEDSPIMITIGVKVIDNETGEEYEKGIEIELDKDTLEVMAGA